jgi:hypothetical protein
MGVVEGGYAFCGYVVGAVVMVGRRLLQNFNVGCRDYAALANASERNTQNILVLSMVMLAGHWHDARASWLVLRRLSLRQQHCVMSIHYNNPKRVRAVALQSRFP